MHCVCREQTHLDDLMELRSGRSPNSSSLGLEILASLSTSSNTSASYNSTSNLGSATTSSSSRGKRSEGNGGLLCNYPLNQPLRKASLLLIDRTQDLYTPCSHGPVSASPPLGHRILSTLPRASPVDMDVHLSMESLQQLLTSQLQTMSLSQSQLGDAGSWAESSGK